MLYLNSFRTNLDKPLIQHNVDVGFLINSPGVANKISFDFHFDSSFVWSAVMQQKQQLYVITKFQKAL